MNALTFLAYSLFIWRLQLPPRRSAPQDDGGYRSVLRDGVFVRLLALNLAFVVGSVALINSLFPVFAKNEAGLSEDTIGLLFLLNGVLIIVFQLPIAKAIEGHRRAHGLALMCSLWIACWIAAEIAGLAPAAAVATILLGAGICALSLGECLYDAIYGPLVADLAPEGKTGRYMGASGLSWQVGFISAPALGGALMGAEPLALWPVVAAVTFIAGLYSLRFEALLPPELRRTPRRARSEPAPTPATAEPAGTSSTRSSISTCGPSDALDKKAHR